MLPLADVIAKKTPLPQSCDRGVLGYLDFLLSIQLDFLTNEVPANTPINRMTHDDGSGISTSKRLWPVNRSSADNRNSHLELMLDTESFSVAIGKVSAS